MLGTELDAALPELRAYAESRMTSQVVVMRKTGAKVYVNGYQVPEWAAVHIDLPFRSSGGSSGDGGSRGVTIGGVTFEEATGIGSVPATTVDLRDNDLLEVTAGKWAGDVYRIVAAIRYDQKTARRLPIVETARPEEWS